MLYVDIAAKQRCCRRHANAVPSEVFVYCAVVTCCNSTKLRCDEVFVYCDVVTCCQSTKLRCNLAVVVFEVFVYFYVVTCCQPTKLRCNLAVVAVPTLSLYRDRSNASI